MFDLFGMLLSSIASFLFPIFASYKALKTSDPSQLTPWLMYWVVFSICLLVESWFSFILFWSTQGARVLYESKVHPFLQENENTIDEFIASAHDRIKTAGMAYFRQAVEYLKTNILNLPPSEQHATPAESASAATRGYTQSYTQSLLARFSVPTAGWTGAANSGNDFYNLLASAVSAGAGFGGGPGAPTASSSGTFVPPHLRDSAERMDFIAAQRERLHIVLGALDREAQQIRRDGNTLGGEDGVTHRSPSGSSLFSGLSKSRSETDFEKVEAESGAEDEVYLRRRQVSSSGSGWMPWGWSNTGNTGDTGVEADDVHAGRKQD
ncbi:hypothetical protein E4U43_003396 [Claviceps pusilla]|uniref:Protein YOP1 n=1 Tax=Claviceps pusilla TaxID=123648 RepID=A0A9P7SUK6_9HYPO|nr:hypothetical protein E4U43_003396 [Claviceps pusilla]